nr:hypothetical protein [Thiolinea sp.]
MPQSSLKTTVAAITVLSACALLAAQAQAEVKYRVGFDDAAQVYVVYMLPDSVPDPDLTLSAQVTLKVPSATGLDVGTIQSAVAGVEWQLHSRVLAPEEDSSGAYLSFGPVFTAGTPPAFGWVAGEEKR